MTPQWTLRLGAILLETYCVKKVEAAGIEPASRDISTLASTCVVDYLGFAGSAVCRPTSEQTSRKRNLATAVPDMGGCDPDLATDFQTSLAKLINPGCVLLRSQCKTVVSCN